MVKLVGLLKSKVGYLRHWEFFKKPFQEHERFIRLIIITIFTYVFSQSFLILFSYFHTIFISIFVPELSWLNKEVLMNYAIGLLYTSFHTIVNILHELNFTTF